MIKEVLNLALCAMLLAPSLTVDAQQAGKIPRIGYLIGGSPSSYRARSEAFRQGLRELGYLAEKNILI